MATRNQILKQQADVQQQVAAETIRHNERMESIAHDQNTLGWANFGAHVLGSFVPVVGNLIATGMTTASNKTISARTVAEQTRHNQAMEALDKERNAITAEANRHSTYGGGAIGLLGSAIRGAAGASTVQYILNHRNDDSGNGKAGPSGGSTVEQKGDALLRKSGISFSDDGLASSDQLPKSQEMLRSSDMRTLSEKLSDWRQAQPSYRSKSSGSSLVASGAALSLGVPLLYAL